MQSLADLSFEELSALCCELGLKPYRAKQLCARIAKFSRYDEMSDIPLSVREKLNESYRDRALSIEKTFTSSDGTVKYLFRLSDGNIIEGAYMTQSYGNTLCVSTQVGCRMGCAFCASGIGGLVRNLTAGEILSQVLAVNRASGGGVGDKRAVTNVVLMGSGEPLDNYENVTKFIRLLSSSQGLGVSERNISLSTCGIVENVYRLADDGFSVTLTFSLHASTDEYRRSVMPIANKYTIAQIIEAAKYYFAKTGRRVIFEYTMLKGVNMNYFDAKRLAELTKGFPSHVNLIMLNPVKEKKSVVGCTKEEGERFCRRLNEMGVSATIRKSKGSDVGGACGQLRRQYIGDKEHKK